VDGGEGVANHLGAQRDGIPAGEVSEAVEVQDEKRSGLDGWPLERLGAMTGIPTAQPVPNMSAIRNHVVRPGFDFASKVRFNKLWPSLPV
jgi:hypothetical protein